MTAIGLRDRAFLKPGRGNRTARCGDTAAGQGSAGQRCAAACLGVCVAELSKRRAGPSKERREPSKIG